MDGYIGIFDRLEKLELEFMLVADYTFKNHETKLYHFPS